MDLIKNCFDKFCLDDEDFILIESLPEMFRLLQKPFPKNYIDKKLNENNFLNKNKFSFDEFLKLLEPLESEKQIREKLIDSFSIFDQNSTGKIQINRFIQIFKESNNEINEEFFQIIDKLIIPDLNGEFEYHLLVDLIISYL